MARRPTLLLLLLSSSLVFVRCAQEQELAEVMQLLKQSLKSMKLVEQQVRQLSTALETAKAEIEQLKSSCRASSTVQSTPAGFCPKDIGQRTFCSVSPSGICHCTYVFNTKTVARETAETACRENGMKLVAIETAAEQQQLAQHLEEAVKVLGPARFPFWTSGSDAAREGQWLWTSTSRPVQFSNWMAGEPDDGSGGQDELMVAQEPPHQWFDGQREAFGTKLGANYICERRT